MTFFGDHLSEAVAPCCTSQTVANANRGTPESLPRSCWATVPGIFAWSTSYRRPAGGQKGMLFGHLASKRALYIYIIYVLYIYILIIWEKKTCHELETHRCMDGWYVYVWEFWGLSTDLGVGLTCSSETSPVNNWEIRSIQLQKALGRIGGHSYRIYFESSIGCSLWSFWLLQVANRVLRP
jgi:hypothetical protein